MPKPARFTLQFATLISSLLVLSSFSHAQDEASPMAAMHTNMAKLGGNMHVVAANCGDYSREQLVEIKAQQKTGLTQAGMSAEAFESVFAAAEQEAREQWSKMSQAEQTDICKQIKASQPGTFTPQ